ncbi:MAG: zinc-binding dehydrogenase [Elusimicrobia bacterium]|nr:zinc-binding dehydrogenase [Elusimicrobiota bacterium]
MRAIVVSRPGGHSSLELQERPNPEPRPGEARVAVKAIGVNFADIAVRLGLYEAAKGRYPIVPGFEFSGVVDRAPEGGRWRAGDPVFGVTRFGAYSSSVVVPQDQLFPCPAGWDFPQCAGIPAVYLTAYYALFHVAHVEAGDDLLIHSAAGGVGTALLQLARIAGCRAIGVVGSEHKTALCLRLGAEAVILRDHRWERRAKELAPSGYDAVFDANGVSTPRPGFRLLAPGGRLVVYGFAELLSKGSGGASWLKLGWRALRVPRFSPLEMTASNRAVMGFNVVFLFHRKELIKSAMERLLGWIGEGKVSKVPVTSFPLEQAGRAHQALESGQTMGKLVLTL